MTAQVIFIPVQIEVVVIGKQAITDPKTQPLGSTLTPDIPLFTPLSGRSAFCISDVASAKKFALLSDS